MKIITMKTPNIPRNDSFRGSIYTVKRKEEKCRILTLFSVIARVIYCNLHRIGNQHIMNLKYDLWNSKTKQKTVARTSQNTTRNIKTKQKVQ
jgi:hypothetical protein